MGRDQAAPLWFRPLIRPCVERKGRAAAGRAAPRASAGLAALAQRAQRAPVCVSVSRVVLHVRSLPLCDAIRHSCTRHCRPRAD